MASPNIPPRTIVPPAGAAPHRRHVVHGSLHVFTHPAQRLTQPVHAHLRRRYEKAGAWARWLVAFDALAAAGLAVFAVVAFSLALRPPTVLRLTVEASAPEVRAADLVGFSVRYENRGKEALADASLALSYPDGFHATAVTAESGDVGIEPLVDDRVISLGRLGPGANGTVRVSGYMLTQGDLRFHALLTGKQGEASVQSQDHFVLVRVVGSALSLRWTGEPTKNSVIGTPAIGQLVVENQGVATIDDLSFTTFCEPQVSCAAQKISALSSGEQRVLGEYPVTAPLVGTDAFLSGTAEGKSIVLVETHVVRDRVSEGPRVEEIAASVSSDGLEVRMLVGTGGLNVFQLQPRFFPQPWSAIDTANLPADAEAEGILGQRVKIGSEKKDIVFIIPLKPDADTSALTIRAVVSDDVAWSSSERVAVQAAAPTLAAELRYYTEEGEQLGRGPLPPRVDEKTEYWVVVRAEPGLITQDTELRVDLGSNVTYAGKFSASVSGVPRQAGNVLIWRPDVIAGDDAFTFAAALAFRPTADQIDAEAVIVRSIRLLGKDAEGAQTEATTGYLATDVPADPRAAEKGTRVSEALE